MGQWKELKSVSEVEVGTRLKIDGKIYDVESLGDKALTLKKLGSEKLTLEYKVSLLIKPVEIWSK